MIATRLLMAGLVALTWSCGQGKTQPPGAPAHEEDADPGTITISPEARANIGLTVDTVAERVIERTLLLNATLKVDPDHEAFVSSRVQGKVTVQPPERQ